jgi:hypothetical protein
MFLVWRAQGKHYWSVRWWGMFWLRSVLYLLMPWSWVFEKLIFVWLVKKFPIIRRIFIVMFTWACYQFLSWSTWIQATFSNSVSFRFILMLCFHLHLDFPSDGLWPSFYLTKILCAFLITPMHAACPFQLVLLDLVTLIMFVKSTNY